MLLLYCMSEPVAAPEIPGVRGTAVERVEEAGLACFFSRIDDASMGMQDALEFSALVQALFARTAVAPFRFPTLLSGEDELREFLRGHAAEYLSALERLRDRAQMDLHFRLAEKPAPAASGKEYLEGRRDAGRALENAAALARSRVAELAQDWRVRETPAGLRCAALLARADVPAFQQRLREMVPGDNVRVVVSGPWPASEFIHAPAPSPTR